MLHILVAAQPPPSGGGSKSPIAQVVAGIFFILVGGLNVVKPDLAYRMNRWQYKNKQAFEPSNAALVVGRLIGGVAVIAGIVILVIAVTR